MANLWQFVFKKTLTIHLRQFELFAIIGVLYTLSGHQ